MKTHKKSSITINISTLIGNLIVVTNNESEAPEAVRQKVAEAFAKLPVCARFEGTLLLKLITWTQGR